jgi:hypothetical protein
MSRLPIVILGVLLTVTMAFASAACGDDDESNGGGDGGSPTDGAVDPEDYYQDVDLIQNSLTEQLDSIGEQSESAYGDPVQARNSLSVAKDAGEQALEDLNALEPASVARTAHANLASASEELIATVDGMIADLQGVEEGPEFEDFLASVLDPESAYSQAAEAIRDACSDMQAAANNSQVDIVFQCPV